MSRTFKTQTEQKRIKKVKQENNRRYSSKRMSFLNSDEEYEQ